MVDPQPSNRQSFRTLISQLPSSFPHHYIPKSASPYRHRPFSGRNYSEEHHSNYDSQFYRTRLNIISTGERKESGSIEQEKLRKDWSDKVSGDFITPFKRTENFGGQSGFLDYLPESCESRRSKGVQLSPPSGPVKLKFQYRVKHNKQKQQYKVSGSRFKMICSPIQTYHTQSAKAVHKHSHQFQFGLQNNKQLTETVKKTNDMNQSRLASSSLKKQYLLTIQNQSKQKKQYEELKKKKQLEEEKKIKQIQEQQASFGSGSFHNMKNKTFKMKKQELEHSILYDFFGHLKPKMEKKYYSDGSYYFGEQVNGKKQGLGIYYFCSREIYGGQWENNKFNGRGVYLYDNNDIYEGELIQGSKSGYGVYSYHNGNNYSGTWLHDKKDGYGIYEYLHQGIRFQGNWKDGKKQGQGKMMFGDGTIYEGEWKAGLPHGQGSMTYGSGDKYIGNWVQGAKQGQGTYTGSLESYEGEWKEDKREGKGVVKYGNGERYEGMLKDGKRHGFGIYYYNSSEVYVGMWNNDLKHGKGHLKGTNMSYFDGEWVEGKREGFGKILYINGDLYAGQWKEDQREGIGKYEWSTKQCSYEGEWKENEMNGVGKFASDEKGSVHGIWNEHCFVQATKVQ